MKKILLSAAAFAVVAVSAIAVAPTTSEAVPAFARQTSAACLSCHFQTFPAINSFGRSFKMGSFTDVGDQALIEDDHLSIPAVLNATFVLRAQVTNTSQTGLASSTTYNIPADAVLMLAGRVGTNSGAFVEFDGGAANWQLINSFDVGDFKVGVGAHKTGFGGSGVLEVSNVFGQHGGKLNGKAISAIQSAGFAQDTVGIGGWVGNDMGYIQFSLIAPAAASAGDAINVGLNFGKLVRVVATLDIGGFDTLIGFGSVTGTAGKANGTNTPANATATGAAARIPMNLQFIDVQLQGDLGDMSVGIYGDWAHAKGKTGNGANGTANFYGNGLGTAAVDGVIGNTGTVALPVVGFTTVPANAANQNNIGSKYDAFSIRAEIKPIDRFMVGIGYGYQKLTQTGGLGTAADITVKTLQLAATYEIYQNMELNFFFQNAKTNGGTILVPTTSTTRTTFLEVEALM